MRWVKKGLIFTAADQFEWMAHHASVPFADKVDERTLRIYFGPRDRQGRTRPAFIEVDPDNPADVLRIHDRPLMNLGTPGAFDDSGVMPSCIVDEGPRKLLYYVGWEQSVTVPYRQAIGLAASTDGGVSFERVFDGPIVDRTPHEPYFCTSPFVLRDGARWRLWYATTTSWIDVDGRQEPRYRIRYAESADGQMWHPRNLAGIEYASDTEASGRPWVVKEHGRYRMWYSYRSINGRLVIRRRGHRVAVLERISRTVLIDSSPSARGTRHDGGRRDSGGVTDRAGSVAEAPITTAG